MPQSPQEKYRLAKWRFYKNKSRRPKAERLSLRKKWWALYEAAKRTRLRKEADAKKITHTSEAGIALIKEFEGFFSNRYDDGVGVQTIGYGTTTADIKPLPTHVTQPEAEALLRKSLADKYEPAVRAAEAKYGTKFTQNEFDALVSFVYNLGPGALALSSGFETLQRALKSKDRKAIADAFLLYSNPNSPAVHVGLLRRRKAERLLFLKV